MQQRFAALVHARVGGLCLSLLLSGATTACGAGSGAKDPSGESGLVGRHAPPFDLPAQAGGERVSLDGASGRVVLVDFWATWCAPCKESFPHYQAMQDRFEGELEIIGISVDDEPDLIASFAEETGVSFPLAWDRNKSVAKAYEPPAMPTSFLVDRNGIVRRVHAGFHDGDQQKLAKEIEHLIQ